MTPEQRTIVLTRYDIEQCFETGELSFADTLNEGAVILVDKPKEWTSFDVVNKIKRTFGIKKVGHAGTLDPMATGLLIVCTAAKTKIIDTFIGLDKTYTGIIKLGESTASYDAETDVIERKPYDHVTEAQLRDATESFTGDIDQIPPMYSALKKNGKPLYKLARKGIEVRRESRRVTVHTFELTNVALPYVSFRISCSKGTYIRSVAHDMGVILGTGGHLQELRRTAIGSFAVDNAVTVDHLNELKDRLKRKHV